MSCDNIDDHIKNCTVCKLYKCKEIEDKYLRWVSPYDLADDYPVSKDAIYRHVRAFGLDTKRDKNHDKLLGAIIERGFKSNLKIGDHVTLRAVELRMKKRKELTDKVEHSGEITTINVQKEAEKQCDNLQKAINGSQKGKDTPDLDDSDEIEEK